MSLGWSVTSLLPYAGFEWDIAGRQVEPKSLRYERESLCRTEECASLLQSKSLGFVDLITYPDFIQELKVLHKEIDKLRHYQEMHEHPVFRKWRNQLEALTNQIEDQGYVLPCLIRSAHRRYGAPHGYGPVSETQLSEDYLRDLIDTLNETSFIIESYEKYGEPRRSSRARIQELRKERSIPMEVSNKTGLEMPDKITLAWLFHHASITLWWWVASILFGVLLIGIAIGQSDIYKEFIRPIFGGE